MKRIPQRQMNVSVRRERDGRAWSLLLAMVCCGVVLATGFVYAARQHFSAVQIGYQSEALRRERVRLLEEQSRLLIAREQAATPARLESSARALGLQPASPAQIGFAQLDNQERAKNQDARHVVVPALAVSAAPLGSR